MKMNIKYTLALVAGLSLATIVTPATAQVKAMASVQPQPKAAGTTDTSRKLETLSGIHLQPTKEGTYKLDFNQVLKEDAVLEIMNNAGTVVYQQPLSIADSTFAWQFDIGALRTDNYQVTVKTSDTTYWSKFKVRNPKPVSSKKKK